MHYQSLLTLFLFITFLPVKLSASIDKRTLQQVLSSFYEEVNYIDRLTSDETKISVFKPEDVDLNSNLSKERKKWFSQYTTRFKQEKVDGIVKKTAETNKEIEDSYTSIQSINWNHDTQTYQSLLTNLRNWVTFYTTYKNEFQTTINAEPQNFIASKTPGSPAVDKTIKEKQTMQKPIIPEYNPNNKQEPRFKITPMRIVLISLFGFFVLSIVYYYGK